MLTRAMLSIALALPILAATAADLPALVRASGVKGGLIVHLDCGAGRDTPALRINERFLVQGLEKDAAKIQRARAFLRAKDVFGKVTVYQYDGRKLPYAGNSVNLIIGTAPSVSRAEIMRVLVPCGVAIIGGKTIRKPWPKEIDQWTHYLRGADNNAVARDTKIGSPRSIQWVSPPRWGRSHEELASMSTSVSANGRVFFIVDEAPLVSIRYRSDWRLVARDAFNGVLLWKRKIPLWIDHLRHFRSGPVYLQRTLVAVGDEVYVTLGLGAPVTALDAATGEVLRVYKGTEVTEEILCDNGVLYLAAGTSEVDREGGGLFARDEPKPSNFRRVMAVDAASGKMLWKKELKKALLPLSLSARKDRVCYQTTSGIVCVDARSGKSIWETARATVAKRMGFSAPTAVLTDDVLLVADRVVDKKTPASTGKIKWGVHGWNQPGYSRKGKSELIAYDLGTGKELWKAPCNEGYNSPVDIFVVNGVAWVGTNFTGYNVKTGKVVKTLSWKGNAVGMGHHRCYRDKATVKYILTGRSGVEMVDYDKGWLNNNSWVRGTCEYGIMPSNGLLYAPPDACACFMRVKMTGYLALGPRRGDGTMRFPSTPVLEKGPAYGAGGPSVQPGDWPMHRHDPSRSGYTSVSVPHQPARSWATRLHGKITQPVVVCGKVLVAEIDNHTVHALNAGSGARDWSYAAGGRIDSAPTVYKGLVLFGAADGWIYALRLTDGVLAWRFRAAPEERLVQSYGQLESTWPVHGSVIVQNNVLYAAAGRVTYLDGGIVLYRLDPVTGKQLSRTITYDIDPKTTRQLAAEAKNDMEGSRNDLLVGDGSNVFIKHLRYDEKGKRAASDKPHLFATGGFTEDEWFVRAYWLMGTSSGAGWGRWAYSAGIAPFGRIMSFTDDKIVGYGRIKIASGKVGHRLDSYHLYQAPKTMRPTVPVFSAKGKKKGKKGKGAKLPAKPSPTWSKTDTPIIRAMVVAKDTIVVAGPPDVGKKIGGEKSAGLAYSNPDEALHALRGDSGALLQIRSAHDGDKTFEAKLSVPPVFDGMSAANGNIYISLQDGTVECWK